MLLREHVFTFSLFDAGRTYAELQEIIQGKLKLKHKLSGEPKLIWCINNDATRAIVLRIGEDQFSLFTKVDNQKHPQNWEWIDQRFDHDRLNLLALSDIKMGMSFLLKDVRGEINNDATTVHVGLPS